MASAAVNKRDRSFCSLAMVVVVALVVAAAWGCQTEDLTEEDAELLRDIFRSGLEMEPDPFVRAETARALKLSDDPRLAQHAISLSRDHHPMVRVAAVRTLIWAEHPDADNRAAHLFNRGDEEEQFHILDIALEADNPELRDTIVESTHNTNSTYLRRHALKKGLIAEIDEADEDARDDLYSELGRFVLDDDPDIAGLALRVLVEAGQTGRADRFLEQLGDESLSAEDRTGAARILAMGRVEEAGPLFSEILSQAGADDPDDLGIASEPFDDELLRWTVLGMAAIGDEDFVAPAQRYLRDARTQTILEVLDALSSNPSPDATLSLRNRLRDRPPVGRQALKWYAPRDDARITSLTQATSHRDLQTRRLAASLLVEHFQDPWLSHLEEQLGYSDPAAVKRTLRVVQSLLDDEDRLLVTEALEQPLENLAQGEQEFVHDSADDDDLRAMSRTISTIAADLLFRLTGDSKYADIIAEHPDRQSLYGHLEFIATHNPGDHLEILRRHLYHDSYAMRLMAATGLWSVYGPELDLQLLRWIADEG